MSLWPQMVDLVFPRTCGGCGIALTEPGLSLCWDCRGQMSVIAPPFCSCCGEPVHGRVDHEYRCHVCEQHPPAYHRARAAIHYNQIGKGLVTQFKYRHSLWLENLLVELLESAVRAHYETDAWDVVCAVPLHPVKQRERGYNQSLLLAGALAKRIHRPLLGRRELIRARMTPSQTRLTAHQRRTNVKGAFKIRHPQVWVGQRVLLVDDVMTTGATVSACAESMRSAGARSVDVVTVARGI